MKKDLFTFKPLKGLETPEDLGKLTLQKIASSEGFHQWAKENPEHFKSNAMKGYLAAKESFHQGAKEWRENSPEEFKAVQEMAIKAFMESEYWHSDTHIASLAKGGVASSKVNLEKGNIGKDSAMSNYKKAKNRKKWAQALLVFKDIEFTPKDAMQHVTAKQWHNIKNISDLVYQTEKRSGYHNQTRWYKLNMKAIEIALAASDNFEDYMKSNI